MAVASSQWPLARPKRMRAAKKGGNMTRPNAVRILLLITAIATLASGCGHKTKGLCCLQYSADSDQATYCNNHRSAVGQFVLDTDEDAESRRRLEQITGFYESIKDCQSVDCIGIALNTDPSLSDFAGYYTTEHDFAERDTNIPEEDKAPLILCGIRHAIDGLSKTLE
jgi:hypothetical protein